MALDRRLTEILVCPQCKGALKEVGEGLSCGRCGVTFPVKSGIPVMVMDEAGQPADRHGIGIRLAKATFRITGGHDAGMTFQLEPGTCRAVGRATVDPNRTAVFHVDISFALDESTKGLILKYIAGQFRKMRPDDLPAGTERLGSFRRAPDIALTDASLSRLHAMIFSDGENIAILDLVSKNGTYVNGKEVESVMIRPGDTIELGDTTMVLES